MDTTIQDLDEASFRALQARGALVGKTIGDMVNEAIRAYLRQTVRLPKHGSLLDLSPEPYGEGSENLSEQIDAVVYGT